MAMKSTVNVCRNNAKLDMVKAILASSVFTEPKDVLIIEEANTQSQHQVLAMHSVTVVVITVPMEEGLTIKRQLWQILETE